MTQTPTASYLDAVDQLAQKKPRAWMRRWYFDGEQPYKVKDPDTGRMITAKKFMFMSVTPHKVLDTDVPLYDHETEKNP